MRKRERERVCVCVCVTDRQTETETERTNRRMNSAATIKHAKAMKVSKHVATASSPSPHKVLSTA
jgi:hypothetical protein